MTISVKNNRGHYEIYCDGKFYCSCDYWDEVKEEIEDLKSEFTNVEVKR